MDRMPASTRRNNECRHTFASLMIAAGVNAKALSTPTSNAPSEGVPREGALHVRCTRTQKQGSERGREGSTDRHERRWQPDEKHLQTVAFRL